MFNIIAGHGAFSRLLISIVVVVVVVAVDSRRVDTPLTNAAP